VVEFIDKWLLRQAQQPAVIEYFDRAQ